jgi:hypothetical protein
VDGKTVMACIDASQKNTCSHVMYWLVQI